MTKGPEAFRTISEAAEVLGVPQHVLRFWETRFSFIRPMKRAGGRRFYRPQDLVVLEGVRRLLHDEGYTIKGVQKLHREQGLKRVVEAAGGQLAPSLDESPAVEPIGRPQVAAGDRSRLVEALGDLMSAKARLDDLLPRP